MPRRHQPLEVPLARPRIKAICFDLDGVLIDTMPLHAQAWQEALQPLGLKVSAREIYQWEGESGIVTARRLLARRGTPPSARTTQALLADKECRFKAMATRIQFNRMLVRLVGLLRRRRVPLGLVTGTSRGEVHRTVPGWFLARFNVVVTGDLVRRGKPHPEPYRTAFRRLGVDSRSALVVENAPYGIRSARRAGTGLVIALASSLPARYLHEAHAVVTTARELATLLTRRLE